MDESEKQFSFTRAASSTGGRAKTQIPISQNQHFVSQVLLRRFAGNGGLQVFDIKTAKWRRRPQSPKRVFCHKGYTQLLVNGQVDNTLEDEFGKVETQLPVTLAALDKAAQKPTTVLPLEVYSNFFWYCAFLWRISPFAKAKAPADFVIRMNKELEIGRSDLLRQVVGVSENDVRAIQKAHAGGKKVIIDSMDFLQLVYRIQFVQRCKEDFIVFRFFTKWAIHHSPVELPISDMAIVQLGFKSETVYLLPISPHLLLVGTIPNGTQSKSEETIIKSSTLAQDDAQIMADAICSSALATLASKNIIHDVSAMRRRGEQRVTYTKVVNPESIVTAGVTDFNGVFGVRLVDDDEYARFIHLHVRQ